MNKNKTLTSGIQKVIEGMKNQNTTIQLKRPKKGEGRTP
jgi:hypothetical protein